MCRESICLASSLQANSHRKGKSKTLKREIFHRKLFIALAYAMVVFVVSKSAFSAQELRVGFITGRGDDAAVEEQAFAS